MSFISKFGLHLDLSSANINMYINKVLSNTPGIQNATEHPNHPPPETTPIANGFSVSFEDDKVTYFSNLMPFKSHDANDAQTRALTVAELRVDCRLPANRITEAMGISRAMLMGHCKTYRKHGSAGFFMPRKEKRCTAIDAQTKYEAEALLAQGFSASKTAQKIGIAVATLTYHIRAGRIAKHKRQPKQPAVAEIESAASATACADESKALQRSARNVRDRNASMGRATTDVVGRTLAMTSGSPHAAAPSFDQSAHSVQRGGVLSALPMLIEQGIDTAPIQLPNGYYSAQSLLTFLALIAMARVSNPEQLRYDAPGEWGQILGLDRCPEVKTLRSKIRLFSKDFERVLLWQQTLSKRWLLQDCQYDAVLLVDGHTKVYSGQGRLAKKFISRQKLCLPAAASYWVNTLGGQPLLCLHQDYDPGMVKALEHVVVKELQAIGAVTDEAPDLTDTASTEAPWVTLVFDREGWSPKMMRRLARKGIACVNWHKNFKAPAWDGADYCESVVTVYGPAQSHQQTVMLAEKSIVLDKDLSVRQIRRRLDSGREVAIVTTHPTLSTEQVASLMFSRWSQENFFKYMRDQFSVDALTSHALAPMDDDTVVVNPRRRNLEKQVNKLWGRITTMRNRIAKLAKDDAKAHQCAQLAEHIEQLEAEHEKVRIEKNATDKHILAGQLEASERLEVLPKSQRLFIDIIRMIAYRAETRMIPAVAGAQGKKTNPRKALQRLFDADANIIPDHDKGLLKVQILGLGSNCVDRALIPLLDELTATETVYPGTNLKLVYELAAD